MEPVKSGNWKLEIVKLTVMTSNLKMLSKWQGRWALAMRIICLPTRNFCSVFLFMRMWLSQWQGHQTIATNDTTDWKSNLFFSSSLSTLLTCPFRCLHSYKWSHLNDVPKTRQTIIAIQNSPPYHLQMHTVRSPLSCAPMQFLIQNVAAGFMQSE